MRDAASAGAPAPVDVTALLVAALGDRVDVSASALETARADKSGHAAPGRALAVVFAESVDDVQQTMRIAHATGTPVVPRGAGTGLAGAANTGAGEISLDLSHMTRILEVSPDDLLAVVEPGLINAELNAALEPHGVWWAPDPASRAISTVGGNIATGAGGLLCAKYGVVRDAVLALDVVLADGTLVHTGHRSVKGVTGYDLTALMIGSEGTLGVVVGATLKLRRLVAGERRTIVAEFPGGVEQAAAACTAVSRSGVQPAILELMDPFTVAGAYRLLGLAAPAPGAAHVTAQTDGPTALDEASAIAAVLRSAGGSVRVSADDAEGERLLEIRRSSHAATQGAGTKLIEDVSVPRTRLAEMFHEIAHIEAQYGLSIPTIAHAGDGNLHPTFFFPGTAVPDNVWEAADDLFQSALRLGGTLTGEHGIGVLKARWLKDELGEPQWNLQRGIKAVFDPTGILNPGKVFIGEPGARATA